MYKYSLYIINTYVLNVQKAKIKLNRRTRQIFFLKFVRVKQRNKSAIIIIGTYRCRGNLDHLQVIVTEDLKPLSIEKISLKMYNNNDLASAL